MDGKKIVLIAVGILLLCFGMCGGGDKKGFFISEVVDGNTVKLGNGTTVKLLGVVGTKESKEYLKNLGRVDVELICDKDNYFIVNKMNQYTTINAYLFSKKNREMSINEQLLKNGLALYVHNCKDLDPVFSKYSKPESITPIPVPEPEPTPVIDYSGDNIKLPEYVMTGERKYNYWHHDASMNIGMLAEACDYNNAYTKCFANQLAARSQGNFNPGQICEIFNYCYNKWRYVNDPKGQEYLATASETIASYLTGDCDDFAILLASCLLAVGADVCINAGYNSSGGHAFTEVDISQFNMADIKRAIEEKFYGYCITNLHTRQSNGRVWLNLDWWANYPGGPYYDCSQGRSYYTCINGKWSGR